MTGNSLPERPYAGTKDGLLGHGSVLIADKEVECAPSMIESGTGWLSKPQTQSP